MSRLQARFDALALAQRKALVPFVTAGDPSLEATVPVLHALVAAGADVLELGVPFSDPMADGPVIQRSSERALGRGAGLAWVLDQVREFRTRDAVTPIVLMGYLNPVEIRGAASFAHAAVDAGVDGVLLVDLPPEEAPRFRDDFDAAGLALVPLASPTTSDARLGPLCAGARGYVYYVSLAGSHLAKIDSATGAATIIEPPTPAQGARRVWSDSKGNLWVSEWNSGNLSRYTPASGEWKVWKLPGDKPKAYAVYVDERDKVWLTDFAASGSSPRARCADRPGTRPG